MIIVEGPDGAGKTTLINQLIDRYDLTVAPRVVSKDTKDLVDLQEWVNRNLSEGFKFQLFDRYRLISEFCYGPTLRPVQRPGFTDRLWVYHSLRRLYNEVQPIIIYCLPPLEVVKANLENDPDNEVVRDHIEQIYAAYMERSVMDALINPHLTLVWDYTKDFMLEDDPLRFFDPVMNYAKGRAEER